MIAVGVLDVQGDVSEHLDSLEAALKELKVKGNVRRVKRASDFKGLHALVIPGGESTTTGKLLREYGLDSEIARLCDRKVPILGTCTGLILLAKEGDNQSGRTCSPRLGLMDIKVRRNAFGRQRESFESYIRIPALGKKPYRCVFIRAPVIEEAGRQVKVMAEYEGKPVMARQDNLLAVAFHPELTEDTRVHAYFLRMIGDGRP
ncbi:MAG: pyridoxal 5'-phosphate synthase glutaminase subunit PdxT [Candidatus Altiarchaeota archaeon]